MLTVEKRCGMFASGPQYDPGAVISSAFPLPETQGTRNFPSFPRNCGNEYRADGMLSEDLPLLFEKMDYIL